MLTQSDYRKLRDCISSVWKIQRCPHPSLSIHPHPLHALTPTIMSNREMNQNWVCSHCHVAFVLRDLRHHCFRCDFDLCNTCYETGLPKDTPSSIAPSGTGELIFADIFHNGPSSSSFVETLEKNSPEGPPLGSSSSVVYFPFLALPDPNLKLKPSPSQTPYSHQKTPVQKRFIPRREILPRRALNKAELDMDIWVYRWVEDLSQSCLTPLNDLINLFINDKLNHSSLFSLPVVTVFESFSRWVIDQKIPPSDEYWLQNEFFIRKTFGSSWNFKFQQILDSMIVENGKWHDRFEELNADFSQEILDSSIELIKQLNCPGLLKEYFSDGANGLKFFRNGIVYKMSSSSDSRYHKMLYHELKGNQMLLNYVVADPNVSMGRIRIPLVGLVRSNGYVVFCSSIVPINHSSLMFGSNDGATHITSTTNIENSSVYQLVKKSSQQLGLALHTVHERRPNPNPASKDLFFAVDVEIHTTESDILYILDAQRLLPSDPSSNSQLDLDWLSRLLRIEHMDHCRQEGLFLSADACSSFCPCSPHRSCDHCKHALKSIEYRNQHSNELIKEWENVIPTTVHQLIAQIHAIGLNIRHLGDLLFRITKQENNTKLTGIFDSLLLEIFSRAIKTDILTSVREKKFLVDVDIARYISDILQQFNNCDSQCPSSESWTNLAWLYFFEQLSDLSFDEHSKLKLLFNERSFLLFQNFPLLIEIKMRVIELLGWDDSRQTLPPRVETLTLPSNPISTKKEMQEAICLQKIEKLTHPSLSSENVGYFCSLFSAMLDLYEEWPERSEVATKWISSHWTFLQKSQYSSHPLFIRSAVLLKNNSHFDAAIMILESLISNALDSKNGGWFLRANTPRYLLMVADWYLGLFEYHQALKRCKCALSIIQSEFEPRMHLSTSYQLLSLLGHSILVESHHFQVLALLDQLVTFFKKAQDFAGHIKTVFLLESLHDDATKSSVLPHLLELYDLLETRFERQVFKSDWAKLCFLLYEIYFQQNEFKLAKKFIETAESMVMDKQVELTFCPKCQQKWTAPQHLESGSRYCDACSRTNDLDSMDWKSCFSCNYDLCSGCIRGVNPLVSSFIFYGVASMYFHDGLPARAFKTVDIALEILSRIDLVDTKLLQRCQELKAKILALGANIGDEQELKTLAANQKFHETCSEFGLALFAYKSDHIAFMECLRTQRQTLISLRGSDPGGWAQILFESTLRNILIVATPHLVSHREFKEIWDIWIEMSGYLSQSTKDFLVDSIYEDLGIAAFHLDKFYESRELFQILFQKFSADFSKAAHFQFNIARTFQKEGDHCSAISHFLQAIEFSKSAGMLLHLKIYGPRCIESRCRLGELELATELAISILNESTDRLGISDPTTINAESNLGLVLSLSETTPTLEFILSLN